MKKIRKTIPALLLSCVMLTACGIGKDSGGGNPPTGDDPLTPPVEIPLDVEHGIGDQSHLYGMCYLLEERNYWGSPFTDDDIAVDIQLIANLGCASVRHWMHCTQLMVNKDTMNEAACTRMHMVLQECQKHGIMNIGMNHHNFNGGVASVGKLKRNLLPGSEYSVWLDAYYTTWYNLVSEFPEVTWWEIDNELNNPDFMYDAYDRSLFKPAEMAAVATDMLYYASRAIHDANPDAKALMGSLTEPMGLGNSNFEASRPSNVWFMQAIYNNIASGEYGYFYSTETDLTASLDPDDYFDAACWHPYVWGAFDEDYFIAENNKVYQVILDNEGKHKKVFLSEVGFTDYGRGEEVVAANVSKMFHAASTSMPYVEMIGIFKMYDVGEKAWSASRDGVDHYGFFYDPNPNRTYGKLDSETNYTTLTSELCTAGAPKRLAYVFQEMAGGSGSLELMVDRYLQ